MGTATRWMELRRGHERGCRRRGQRVRVQPGCPPRDRLRPRGTLPALVGGGGVPAPARDHARPRRHPLAHGRPASHDPAVHCGGKAPPHDRRPGPGGHAARWQALQPSDPCGPVPRTGDVYISDGYGNSRVHKFDPRGRHLRSWGEPGTDPGCFNIPHNIATDTEGLVYVADRENHRVQIFDSEGRYQDQWSNVHRPCGSTPTAARATPSTWASCRVPLPSMPRCPTSEPGSACSPRRASSWGVWAAASRASALGSSWRPTAAPWIRAANLYVAEVSWTARAARKRRRARSRSLQKFARRRR